MRDAVKIFTQIKDLIPMSELEFHDDMKWVIEDAFYKAPEETLQWHRCFNILQKHIPKPLNDWNIKIWSIFCDISEDEIISQMRDN